MVAVPEVHASAPVAECSPRPVPLAHCQRVVAAVDSTVELLRPESDLLRVISGIPRVDVLVALDAAPAVGTVEEFGRRRAGPELAEDELVEPDDSGYDDAGYDDAGYDDAGNDDSEYDEYDDEPGYGEHEYDEHEREYEQAVALQAELRGEIERLNVPGLRVHHLGLRPPLGPPAQSDLVAALSELVGFDPEPGVYCLAPATDPNDAGRSVVVAAARRIARVYGLPMMRYRCLELAVVPEPQPEGA